MLLKRLFTKGLICDRGTRSQIRPFVCTTSIVKYSIVYHVTPGGVLAESPAEYTWLISDGARFELGSIIIAFLPDDLPNEK